MATHKSALKKQRRDIERRTRNRAHRARLRTAIKRFRRVLADGEIDAATALLPTTLGMVDHGSKLGAIHDNAAARTKSRLTKALNRAGS